MGNLSLWWPQLVGQADNAKIDILEDIFHSLEIDWDPTSRLVYEVLRVLMFWKGSIYHPPVGTLMSGAKNQFCLEEVAYGLTIVGRNNAY